MFFDIRRKKQEIPLDKKIEKAILKKKRQMVAMYLIGALGAGSWSFLFWEGGPIIHTLTSKENEPAMAFSNPAIETAQAAEIVEEEAVKEWKTAEFSAYTASVDETDSSPLVMASGKMVYVGAIACPRSIELGTKVEVRGVGVFTCEDRLGPARIDGNYFDIFKMTKQEARAFGRKTLEWREA